MKEFSPTGEKLIHGLRAAFGAGDFSPKTVVERSELLPFVKTLVGRRGQVTKRLGVWLRKHKDSVAGEFMLSGEYSTHKRRWTWCIESPNDGPSAEDIVQTIEETGEKVQAKIAQKPTPLAQLAAGERLRVKLERNISKAEDAAARAAAREQEREERHEQRKALRAAERAAELWGVLIKGRSKYMPKVLSLLRDPFYNAQVINGQHIVLCSKERAGEIAAKLHQIVRSVPHANASAVAVRIGETPAQKQQRRDASKRARLENKRNRPARPMIEEGCDSEQRALLAAVGAGTIPRAPLGRTIFLPGSEIFKV